MNNQPVDNDASAAIPLDQNNEESGNSLVVAKRSIESDPLYTNPPATCIYMSSILLFASTERLLSSFESPDIDVHKLLSTDANAHISSDM